MLHNRLGAAWPLWVTAVGILWYVSYDGISAPVLAILIVQVVLTAARCPWRTVVSCNQGTVHLDLALGPFGLLQRHAEIRKVRVHYNRVSATPANGLPIPYWLATPWRLDHMEDCLRKVGVTVSD